MLCYNKAVSIFKMKNNKSLENNNISKCFNYQLNSNPNSYIVQISESIAKKSI